MWTTLTSLDGDSAFTLSMTNCGLISIGFQTVPLTCRTTVGWLLSFEVTVTVFVTGPLYEELLNWMGMSPVLPGSTWCDHSPAVVQPQEGCTFVSMSNSSPPLVKAKVCLTGSPALTLPKS